jgi:hypothetical protein
MALGMCGNDLIPESEAKQQCHEAIRGLSRELKDSGLYRLAQEADRLDASLKHNTPLQIMALMMAFRGNLIHEFTESLFLRLPPESKHFFMGSQFTKQSIDAFIAANRDMEAASRCLAFDEWDAVVFHCMKVFEVGIVVVADKFGVRHAHQNWQNIINDIQGKVKGICEASHGQDWKKEEQFYSGVVSHFQFTKNAWRNYVMHLREHYDQREASQVFTNVRDFMDRLSQRFATQGA